jgi:hypothetical protein
MLTYFIRTVYSLKRNNFVCMRACLFFGLSLFAVASVHAQIRSVGPAKKSKPVMTYLSAGAGLANSVLYLTRNVKEDNDAQGYQFSLSYHKSTRFRYILEYTWYKPLDILPTWEKISAYTLEANANVLFRVSDGAGFFYPQFGISYNVFTGFYTGISDHLKLSRNYEVNSWVTTRWVGVNIGTGYEYRFRRMGFYVDYRMRVGMNEQHQVNITDVCINGGLRYSFIVIKGNKLFRGTRSRYALDLEEGD